MAGKVKSPSRLHQDFYRESYLDNVVCPQENLQVLKAVRCCCLASCSRNLPFPEYSRLWGRNVKVANTSKYLSSYSAQFSDPLYRTSLVSFCFLSQFPVFTNTHFCLLQAFPKCFLPPKCLSEMWFFCLSLLSLLLDVSETWMWKALLLAFISACYFLVKMQFDFLFFFSPLMMVMLWYLWSK